MKSSRKVEQLISTLTIEEKVGQLFILAFAGEDIEYAKALIKHYHVGGFYITDDNAHSLSDAKVLSNTLQQQAALRSCDAALILAVDQEGAWGILTQETDLGPGNLALGKANNLKQTEQMYRVFAQQMQEVGYNTLLAPCADVNSNPDNPIIGQRSFGEHPELVSDHITAAVSGVITTGNLACAKHFPGHGDTATDSHRTLPRVEKSLEQLIQQDLQPFAAAISAGVPMIMTAHINYPLIDQDYPATLSKTLLTDILKTQMGFDGLIITDSMNMWAMRHHYTPSEAAILSLKAGAHLIMLSEEHYENETTPYKQIQQETIQGVINAVKSGELPEQQLDDILKHVLCIKYEKLETKHLVNPLSKVQCQQISANAAESAIRMIRNKHQLVPLKNRHFTLTCAADPKEYEKLVNSRGIGPNDPYSASSVVIEQLKRLNANFDFLPYQAFEKFLVNQQWPNKQTPVVLLTEDYPLPGEDFDQQAQIHRIKKAQQVIGDNLIVLALRSDYQLAQLPKISTYICSYSSRKESAKALANILLNINKQIN